MSDIFNICTRSQPADIAGCNNNHSPFGTNHQSQLPSTHLRHTLVHPHLTRKHQSIPMALTQRQSPLLLHCLSASLCPA